MSDERLHRNLARNWVWSRSDVDPLGRLVLLAITKVGNADDTEKIRGLCRVSSTRLSDALDGLHSRGVLKGLVEVLEHGKSAAAYVQRGGR